MTEPESNPQPNKKPQQPPPQKPVWPSGSIQKEASEKSEKVDVERLKKLVDDLLNGKKKE